MSDEVENLSPIEIKICSPLNRDRDSTFDDGNGAAALALAPLAMSAACSIITSTARGACTRCAMATFQFLEAFFHLNLVTLRNRVIGRIDGRH